MFLSEFNSYSCLNTFLVESHTIGPVFEIIKSFHIAEHEVYAFTCPEFHTTGYHTIKVFQLVAYFICSGGIPFCPFDQEVELGTCHNIKMLTYLVFYHDRNREIIITISHMLIT